MKPAPAGTCTRHGDVNARIMKTEHTLGPWKTEFQQYEDGSHLCIADKEGNWIADIGKEEFALKSNAKLIAAAPELLRALLYVRGVLANAPKGQYDGITLKTMNKAIKSATGKID